MQHDVTQPAKKQQEPAKIKWQVPQIVQLHARSTSAKSNSPNEYTASGGYPVGPS